jgi:hypothetical protein
LFCTYTGVLSVSWSKACLCYNSIYVHVDNDAIAYVQIIITQLLVMCICITTHATSSIMHECENVIIIIHAHTHDIVPSHT